jgi:hypothetical protein
LVLLDECTNIIRYPSLLESSDVDGGSSVAVLTYLRRILDMLDHAELIHMILNYLLALSDFAPATPKTPRSPAAVKRRQSLMLLNGTEKEDERMNPSLFNLVDLVLSSTSSRDAQTVIAALKLTTVILGKNHGYALGSLIKIIPAHHKEPHRTIGALNAELETYLGLASSIASQAGLEEAYDSHLKDKLSMLENHPCSLKSLALPNTSLKSMAFGDLESGPRDVRPHYLAPEDPLLRSLLDSLLFFLTNDVETNLALTETIITIGTCSQLRLEGWLSVDPADYCFSGEEIDPQAFANEGLQAMQRAGRQPTWDDSAAPPVLTCLLSLQSQIEALRADIQDWDDHVTNRKHVIRSYEEMNDVSKNTTPQAKPTPGPSETPAGSWTPQIPKHVTDNSTAPSRTVSPRGRKEGLASKHTPTTSPAPSKLSGQALPGSPARGVSPLPAPRVANRQTTFMADVWSNLAEVNNEPYLKRRIRFQRRKDQATVEVLLSKYQPPPKDSADDTTAGTGVDDKMDDIREASLGHIITNVLILQEFLLELVALMQVRASLFNEVRFA